MQNRTNHARSVNAYTVQPTLFCLEAFRALDGFETDSLSLIP